jgi:hypothetical protein
MEYVLRTTRVPRRTYVQVRVRSTGQENDPRRDCTDRKIPVRPVGFQSRSATLIEMSNLIANIQSLGAQMIVPISPNVK